MREALLWRIAKLWCAAQFGRDRPRTVATGAGRSRTLSAHYGRGLRVKGGCGRSADGAAGVPPASEITPPFRDLRFVP
jgi:hypothetical protein